MICFVKALHHLTKHVPFEEIKYPRSHKAMEFVERYRKQTDEMKRKIEDHKYDIGLELSEEQTVKQDSTTHEVLPCLLLITGSGGAILKVVYLLSVNINKSLI